MNPKKFTCVACGVRFKKKHRMMLHVFNNHLRLSGEREANRFCFCQPSFPLAGSWSFNGWREHLAKVGGLQAHWAAHALNIIGGWQHGQADEVPDLR
jgi:hypothetical protein